MEGVEKCKGWEEGGGEGLEGGEEGGLGEGRKFLRRGGDEGGWGEGGIWKGGIIKKGEKK
jgi:hypothetical protein